jgi:hypothetical protein
MDDDHPHLEKKMGHKPRLSRLGAALHHPQILSSMEKDINDETRRPSSSLGSRGRARSGSR